MATTFSASLSMKASSLATTRVSFQKLSSHGRTNLSFNMNRSIPARLSVSCAAKPETVEKVSSIVREQLSLKDDQEVVADTTFSEIGADSLDTVEIVMGLEEEFGIEIAEDRVGEIKTIKDVADLIEKIIEEDKK